MQAFHGFQMMNVRDGAFVVVCWMNRDCLQLTIDGLALWPALASNLDHPPGLKVPP